MNKTIFNIMLVITLTGSFFCARAQEGLRSWSSSSITAPIRFIMMDSSKIAYKVIGRGSPIIFLQRFRGNLNDWDPAFVDAVAKKYQVILFDAPGIGSSTGEVPLSMTKMADQAVQFAHTLGIEKANYLGWSMGGAVAQAVGINHSEKVIKLILLATGPAGNPESVPGSPEFGFRARKPVYDFEDYQYLFFYHSPSSKAACTAFLERTGSIKQQDAVTRPASVISQSSAVGDFKTNKEKDYFKELKNIKIPVLIANGKFDPSYPLVNSYVLAREIPNAKLIVYPDSGHGFLFQYHEEFARELIGFLSSNP